MGTNIRVSEDGQKVLYTCQFTNIMVIFKLIYTFLENCNTVVYAFNLIKIVRKKNVDYFTEAMILFSSIMKNRQKI